MWPMTTIPASTMALTRGATRLPPSHFTASQPATTKRPAVAPGGVDVPGHGVVVSGYKDGFFSPAPHPPEGTQGHLPVVTPLSVRIRVLFGIHQAYVSPCRPIVRAAA